MKLYVLTAVAVISLGFLNSCKKETPGYCTENYFGDIRLTDALGNATSTFGVGDDITMNMPFTNSSGDSLKLNYSEPWIIYEIYSGGQFLVASDVSTGSTGVTSVYLGAGEGIDGTYTWSGFAPGSYEIKARCYYQYKNCNTGLQVEERSTKFSVQ